LCFYFHSSEYFQALLRGQANIISKLDELLERKATMTDHQEDDSTFSSKYKKLLPAANENQLKELENEFKNRTFVGNLVRLSDFNYKFNCKLLCQYYKSLIASYNIV